MRYPALVLFIVSTVITACASGGRAGLDERLAPPEAFVREPYLIGVSDSSAAIRWTSSSVIQPGLRFWADGDTTSIVLPDSGRNHTFVMTELAPYTEYTYQIQFADSAWSDAATFKTFAAPGDREPFTFLVMGDSGTLRSQQLELADVFNKEPADLWLHTGDIAYADGTVTDFTEKFFRVYAPLLKRVPFFPAPGDHDLRTDGGAPYTDAFTPPGGWGSGSKLNYGFTYGNVRFLSLYTEDSEHEGRFPWFEDPDSDPGKWLRDELTAAYEDPGIDWIITVIHHPPYSASTGISAHGSHMPTRRALMPLADEFNIALVFSGHDHDYQRSKPLRGNEVVEEGEGTVYIVSGGGGGRSMFRGTGSEWFTAQGVEDYHFVRARVDGYTIRIEAVNRDGSVIDSHEMEIPEDRRGDGDAEPELAEETPDTEEDPGTISEATTEPDAP